MGYINCIDSVRCLNLQFEHTHTHTHCIHIVFLNRRFINGSKKRNRSNEKQTQLFLQTFFLRFIPRVCLFANLEEFLFLKETNSCHIIWHIFTIRCCFFLCSTLIAFYAKSIWFCFSSGCLSETRLFGNIAGAGVVIR